MLNQITIMGRLTGDPELKATTSGTSVTTFCVAVDRDFANGDGEREADFLDVVAWKSAAEFIHKHFRKGSMIVVSGRLQTRAWKDKEGRNRKSTEVIAQNVYFGEPKKREDTGGSWDEVDNDGPIPF